MMVGFTIQKVENHINNSCNTASMPDGLYEVAVERVCGEYLFAKKQSGQLEGFDLDAAVKQVATGDTSVSFDGIVNISLVRNARKLKLQANFHEIGFSPQWKSGFIEDYRIAMRYISIGRKI